MTTVGDLIASTRRCDTFQRWLVYVAPALALEVEAAAKACAESPATYARIAVAEFSRYADSEDWTTLQSKLQHEADPALACLGAMLRWRLDRDAGHPGRTLPPRVNSIEEAYHGRHEQS